MDPFMQPDVLPFVTQGRIRLILTDIDGTILPYGSPQVSERTLRAFHAALGAGIHIGPASGRGFSHIPASFGGDEACSRTCLATNGMQVYLDGRLVQEQRLPREAVVRLAQAVAPIAHAGVICFEDGVPLLVEGDVGDLEQSFPLYARTCRAVTEVPHHDIEKANVFVSGTLADTQAVMDAVYPQVAGIDLNLPMAGFLNVTPQGWSKAQGIDVLCAELGISLDQVAVFGDGGNDVEMLAHVPHSMAVSGAAPAAAAAARYRIGPCEDDAVARVIEEIVRSTRRLQGVGARG